MAAVVTASPSAQAVNEYVTVTGTGGADDKNRVKLDGTVVWTGCSDTTFSAQIQLGSVAGTSTIDWEQYIAGTWTSVDTFSETVTGDTSSGALVITTNNQTVSDLSFTASSHWTGTAIYAHGTSGSAPITNLTIRRCTFSDWNIAIDAEYVDGFTVEDCVINDVLYAGILGFSVLNGTIQRNTISRVGYQTAPPVEVNAYGIALTRVADANFTTHPRSATCTIDSNTITDVPTWEGIDTHAGSALTFSNNILRRCYHPVVLGPDGAGNQAQNITFTTGQVLEAKGRGFGLPPQGNIAAITINDLHAASAITNNQISTTFPTATYGRVYDYGGLSTGVTISGNTDVT